MANPIAAESRRIAEKRDAENELRHKRAAQLKAAMDERFKMERARLKALSDKSELIRGAVLSIHSKYLEAALEMGEIKAMLSNAENADGHNSKSARDAQANLAEVKSRFSALEHRYNTEHEKLNSQQRLCENCRQWLAGAEQEFADSFNL